VAVEAAAIDPPTARRLAHRAAKQARELTGADNFRIFDGAPGHEVAAAKGAAAQALAHTGESEAATALAWEIHQSAADAGNRATVAMAAGLRLHDAATSVRLIEQQRERVLASCTGPIAARGLVGELAELLTALGDADEHCQRQLHQAVEEANPRNVAFDTVDFLSAVLLASQDDRARAYDFLIGLEEKRQKEFFKDQTLGGFALAHAVFGDLEAARGCAGRDNVPTYRAQAFAAVASYLTGTPTGLRSIVESTGTAHIHVLLGLALLQAPVEAGRAREAAVAFAADALVGDGWYHVLPVLARIAPPAIEQVRDIVFAHRRLPVSIVSGGF
jgi:hypothetical protein